MNLIEIARAEIIVLGPLKYQLWIHMEDFTDVNKSDRISFVSVTVLYVQNIFYNGNNCYINKFQQF